MDSQANKLLNCMLHKVGVSALDTVKASFLLMCFYLVEVANGQNNLQ
jgi:hypothetical protein